MPPRFNSTRERHDYYKEELLKYGRIYRVELKDAFIGDLCIFIDAMITTSKGEDATDAPTTSGAGDAALSIPKPEHFIPEGARCPSCGREMLEGIIRDEQSDSVHTLVACDGCGAISTYYMNNAIAALIKKGEDTT